MTTLLSMRTIGLISAAWAVLSASAVAGDQVRDKPKPLTAQECERLVQQLANPKPQPFAKSYVLRLPPGVSTAELARTQAPIAAAYDQLSANIETSLPVLMAHLDDERFSFVRQDGISGVYMCTTVGGACSVIVDEHVMIYSAPVTKADSDGRRKSLWYLYDEFDGDLAKWWKGREKKTLAELQLEPIDWALKQPQPKYFSAKEWKDAQAKLEQMAKQIRSTNRPIEVVHQVSFFGK